MRSCIARERSIQAARPAHCIQVRGAAAAAGEAASAIGGCGEGECAGSGGTTAAAAVSTGGGSASAGGGGGGDDDASFVERRISESAEK